MVAYRTAACGLEPVPASCARLSCMGTDVAVKDLSHMIREYCRHSVKPRPEPENLSKATVYL